MIVFVKIAPTDTGYDNAYSYLQMIEKKELEPAKTCRFLLFLFIHLCLYFCL